MVFKYTASFPSGGKERGVITAENREEAELLLKNRDLTILKIESVSSSISKSPHYMLAERSASEKFFARIFITSSQTELALGQLSSMLEGGVPIVSSFQTVASQSGYFLSRALFVVANKLQTGKALTETIREELPFLGNVIIGMISAGEANGDVDKMCSYSAELLERVRKLKGQVIQALAYPVLVILATVAVVTFLMTKVIPKIMTFLSGRSGSLPPMTQALVDVSEYLKVNGLYILAAPVIFAIVIVLLRKSPVIAVHIDHIALWVPMVGKVMRASSNMLWCRTMGILLHSGINIVPALEFTGAAMGNNFYKSEIAEMKQIISQGHPLSTALRVSGLKRFIPLADSMLVVGENTGRMDSSLLKVADFCDMDLQRRIALLSKMIEPALFVVVGGIVGFVYIAFFLGLMAASTGK